MALLHTIAPFAGALLMALVLLDVFLTVLYARIGTGFISHFFACLIWRVFRTVGKPLGPRRHDPFLSYCGPVILVAIVVVWMCGLVLGSAMITWPKLGTAIRAP